MLPHRTPAGRGGVDGDDDRVGPNASPLCRHVPVFERDGRSTFEEIDAGLAHRAPQRTHEPRRLHRPAVAKEDATAEHRRADPALQLLVVERNSFFTRTELLRGSDCRLDRGVLRGRGRDLQQTALAKPDVVTQGANSGDDVLARARECQRSLVAERRAGLGEACPVAMDEAAVPPARAGAAAVRLDDDDPRRRILLPQRKRGPEPRVSAADDAHVRDERQTSERRRGVVQAGLVPPPGRQTRLD